MYTERRKKYCLKIIFEDCSILEIKHMVDIGIETGTFLPME